VEENKVKCLVWDLDNTLWDGTLLEGDDVELKQNNIHIIKTLDSRGILQSIASKNDYTKAMEKLHDLGLENYFLYPQISWNSKSHSIKRIADSFNIGIDSIAFIDDQPFEREEVKFTHPDVLCIDENNRDCLLDMPEMNPRFITEDSKIRRLMYLSDIERNKQETEFVGPTEEFLASLGMKLTISEAKEDDLQRAEELTVRTHQLNTTGYTYSYDELNFFRCSKEHLLLVASLIDRYGTYGKIGLVLVECSIECWNIKLLLMSCRVMSRGVGGVLITHLRNQAKNAGVRLQSEMISNDRNRMMYMTYKFSNFVEKKKKGDLVIFENDLTNIPGFPEYMKVATEHCSE
jgi:FkbH-like protein